MVNSEERHPKSNVSLFFIDIFPHAYFRPILTTLWKNALAIMILVGGQWRGIVMVCALRRERANHTNGLATIFDIYGIVAHHHVTVLSSPHFWS